MSVFKPSDVKTILPKIFNMKWNSDVPLKKIEKFLEGILGYYQEKDQYRTIDELIELMDKVVQDKYFNNFYKNLVSWV